MLNFDVKEWPFRDIIDMIAKAKTIERKSENSHATFANKEAGIKVRICHKCVIKTY